MIYCSDPMYCAMYEWNQQNIVIVNATTKSQLVDITINTCIYICLKTDL